MKLAVLFSGGKDSTYAAYLEKKKGNELVCLISIVSENKASYMFHTPNINLVSKQAEAIGLPIILKKTKGIKEEELEDLKLAIKQAISKYKIEGIITGALASRYQAERIQKICDELRIKCLNPLWKNNQFELLEELVKNKFKIIIIGTFAQGMDKLLGKIINQEFINEVKKIHSKLKINPAGEGGEFESFVLNCPLFKKEINITQSHIESDKEGGKVLVIDKLI
jgi:asparagine synthase (glutamine-hydrolysing)